MHIKPAQEPRALKLCLELEEIFCTCVNEDYKAISKCKIVLKPKRQAVITLGSLYLPSCMFRKGKQKDINFLLISDSLLTYIDREQLSEEVSHGLVLGEIHSTA